MSEKPSNIQLLDMAREVLSICTDNSLTDILKDLEMTHSSELTINRIFDGQFLSPVAPEVVPPRFTPEPPQRTTQQLNTPLRNNPAIPRHDSIEDNKNLVVLLSSSEEEGSTSYDNLSRNRQKSETRRVPFHQEDSPPSPSPKSGINSWPFEDMPDSPLHGISSHEKFKNERSWSPKTSLADVHDDGIRIQNNKTRSRTVSPLSDAQWDLPPIDPQFNPRKKLEVSRKKDRTGSSIEQDPLNDWDFDAQADQDEGPASAEHSLSPILMSSQSNHAGLKQPSSLAPTSVGSSSFSGIKSGWSDDDWSTLPKESSGLGFKAQSASVLASTPARTISTSAIAAKDWSNDESFSPTKSKSSNGSRSRSISRTSGTTTAPLGSSYTPKKDWSKDDLDWRKTSPCSSPLNRRNSPPRLLPSRTNTTPYMELSDDSDNNPGLPSMRDLIGRSLSPPTIFHDDSENTEEEDLMEDVFANNSKRKGKGLKKSLSATRLSQSKKRPRATSPDLQEWGMSDSDAGYNSLSMEAIVAKRTKKRAGFVDDDSDLDEKKEAQKKAKATELALKKAAKDAALQQKREEREKAKSIREEAQQRKRELKEQGRLAKEEDRLAEKRAARDIRIANRLTTKSDSVKEMILCMEDSLLRTSFGQAVEDYLKEVESHIHKQKTTDERAGAGGTGSTPSEQSIMFWRRTVVRRYDEEQDQFIFLPGGKPEISLEPFALVYITGGDFAAMIEQGRLRQELAILKQEMKIRKNKEMMKQQSQNLKLRDLRLQRQRVIYLINGLEEYLRKLKRVKHKNYQQRVLENLGQAPTGAARELTAEQDEEKIEQELLWLQLEQDCLVVQAANEEEAALNVVSLTEQIGLRPYKEARKSKLNICVEGIKSGSDPADTWIKSLQMIHMVTLNMAKAIAEKYPTIKSLYEGYRQCNTLTQAHNMLAEIQASRRVGPTVSRRIFDVFMSEDPNLPTTTAGSNRLAGNNSSQ